MIKEPFQYHLVILLISLCYWRADMLIDYPLEIEEGNEHHFDCRLLLTNLFHLGFATMEPHLWLKFCFRIIRINPGWLTFCFGIKLINPIRQQWWYERKSGSWEIRARFSKHTERQRSISSAWTTWGNHIEQVCFIPNLLVKMCWIDIFGLCRLSAMFWMNEWMNEWMAVLFNHCWHCIVWHLSHQFLISRLHAQCQQTLCHL